MVFPVVMYGCESWTIKKAEHWRIDTFELWCCRRLLIVPWTARRSNQSILKAISSECSLEGLTLKLKLQYLGHLMWRANSFEKILMLGKIEGRRRRRRRHHWLSGHEFGWKTCRYWKNDIGGHICREGMETQIYRTDLTQLGKERVGWTGKVASTYIHYQV